MQFVTQLSSDASHGQLPSSSSVASVQPLASLLFELHFGRLEAEEENRHSDQTQRDESAGSSKKRKR